MNQELTFKKALMDGMKEMVFIMRAHDDQAFVYDFLNTAAMKRTGFTEAIIGHTFHDVYPDDIADNLDEKYRKACDTGRSITYDGTFVTSGQKYHDETTLTPLFNDEHKCTHIMAIVRDVTDVKRSMKKLKESNALRRESEQWHRSLLENNPDAILSVDLNGTILSGNDAVELITGYAPQEYIGRSYDAFVMDEIANVIVACFQKAVKGIPGDCQTKILTKYNKQLKLHVRCIPITTQDQNTVMGIYCIVRDITELIEMTRKYQESDHLFRTIAENSDDLITMINCDGEIIYVSPSYKEILGYDHHEYVGKLFTHNVHQDYIEDLKNTFVYSMENGSPWRAQFRQEHRENGWIWSELHGSPIFDENGHFTYMVVVTRDITLRISYEERLKHFAFHDSLTELPNRRMFNDRFSEIVQNCQNEKDLLAVIIMDLDHFKLINDTMGHDAGDEVIKEFGKRVKRNIRSSDILARLGGDEYVLLLSCIESVSEVVDIVNRIRSDVKNDWIINGRKFQVYASFGVAIAYAKMAVMKKMLKYADITLYEAKEVGGDQYKLKDLATRTIADHQVH